MLQLFQRRTKKTKGFTLIELIVVIAILAILALIAVPRLAGFTEQAKQTTDEELCAVLANAAAMYYARHDAVPASTTVLNTDGLTQYIDNDAVVAAFKSAKYKAGTPVVTYAAAAAGTGGSVTVTIGDTNKYSVTK